MPCVLIIDDNSSVLQALEFFFLSEGYAVLGAPNGREGLRMAAENPVDIVLLDIEMPEMSGIAVCETMKQNAALRHLPIVMMTGRPTRDLVTRGLAAGAALVLGKPFDLGSLRKTVAELLEPTAALPVVMPEIK